MADEKQNPSTEDLNLAYIPEQYIPSGKPVELSFMIYAHIPSHMNVEFSATDFPEGLTLDPNTGIVSGNAPTTELNESFMVSITVTDVDTGKYAQSIFRLEVIGSLLLETDEGKAFFNGGELSFSQVLKDWEMKLFIQQIIREHFAWVLMYDESKALGDYGKFLSQREATTGWLVYNFENAVIISPGNKAFEQYGNRGRLLDTLRESLSIEVSQKKWPKVYLDASDLESGGKAWIVAQELSIPVDDRAPSDIAEINLYNLKRVYEGKTPSLKHKPSMG